MLLKQKAAKDAEMKQNGHAGTFVSREARLAQKGEVDRAHFSFGNVDKCR